MHHFKRIHYFKLILIPVFLIAACKQLPASQQNLISKADAIDEQLNAEIKNKCGNLLEFSNKKNCLKIAKCEQPIFYDIEAKYFPYPDLTNQYMAKRFLSAENFSTGKISEAQFRLELETLKVNLVDTIRLRKIQEINSQPQPVYIPPQEPLIQSPPMQMHLAPIHNNSLHCSATYIGKTQYTDCY